MVDYLLLLFELLDAGQLFGTHINYKQSQIKFAISPANHPQPFNIKIDSKLCFSGILLIFLLVTASTLLINITVMETEQPQLTPKNTFSLQLRKEGPMVTVSSNFDSGNMARAEVGLNHAIVITPAQDCSTALVPSHSKGWFYFSVRGVPVQTKVKFVIKKMSPMSTQVFVCLFQLKFSDYFRPVYKVSGQQWQRLQQAIVFTKEDDTQLHFEFLFHKSNEVFFAYCYPFSYQDCEKMLRNTLKDIKSNKNIYYRDEIMIRSPQGRSVHLLTVSSNDDKMDYREDKINQYLFNNGERCHEFKENKKVVFITARVHPGQSPSSHTFNGILKFILSNDARAHFLRKNFVFKLVPMLNPDGVYHGHYRMDIFGQNLNRFYIQPDIFKQPSVYAVKSIGQYYSSRQSLCFYIDLHAHPQKKGNFIYGNSMQTTPQQAQTQLFARLLSLNCIQFDYLNSSFSKHHMNAKDKNQDMTKEGAGRVVFNTHFKVPYAYTMECGYTCSNHLNEICPIQNSHRKFQKMAILTDQMQNIKSAYYNGKKSVCFTMKAYENLGKNILVSILDLFGLNPASRIPNTPMKTLAGVRQEIIDQLNKASMTYSSKMNRLPATQGTIRPFRPNLKIDKKIRGHLIRAPSIESTKEIPINKLRNRTLVKVNIGGHL